MQIQLSDHFDFKKLIRFTVPSIIMMVFTSIYGVVDGFFVSNFVDKTAFTAVNFIMPYLMILGAVGFMFGTGGAALISKVLGEGDKERATRIFSMLIYVSLGVGVLLAVLGIATLRPVAALLGAEGRMLDDCVLYGTVILIALPAFILQYEFQCLFITAEKPKLGLYVTLAAGFGNMILDALLVAVFPLGLVGAALATAISQCIGGILPLFYFARKNSSILRLVPARPELGAMGKVCVNGSSELMANIAMSVVGILYNAQLLAYAGEDGVAAYGVLMYVNFIFLAVFIGYAIGVAPVVGYHFGAGNSRELRGILLRSTVIIATFALVMFALAELLAYPLSYMFVGYDEALLDMTVRGFFVCSFSFLFAGFAIYASSFFTALNDGLTSALLSFMRTLIFQVSAVLFLPLIMELDGIWLSVVVAEALAVVMSAIFLIAYRKRYGYGKMPIDPTESNKER